MTTQKYLLSALISRCRSRVLPRALASGLLLLFAVLVIYLVLGVVITLVALGWLAEDELSVLHRRHAKEV